jgi:hypothetical protein
MTIPELFSRRQRAARGEYPDVYQYDSVPLKLRVQIWHIITDALGVQSYGDSVESIHGYVSDVIKREYGLLKICENWHRDKAGAVAEMFRSDESVEKLLDVVELYFTIISNYVRTTEYRNTTKNHRVSPDEAIAQLNIRFKENGVGYQFESGTLIRLDSEFLHAEAVRPTLKVLSDPRFVGANEEFLSAHQHFREGRNEECLVDCCKAFESTMKTICQIRGWAFRATDTAKALINTCFANRLLPSYLESEMTALRTLFESGIPTVRNKAAGHGQGTVQRAVPDLLARYVLNQTATTILFLAEAAESSVGRDN